MVATGYPRKPRLACFSRWYRDFPTISAVRALVIEVDRRNYFCLNKITEPGRAPSCVGAAPCVGSANRKKRGDTFQRCPSSLTTVTDFLLWRVSIPTTGPAF